MENIEKKNETVLQLLEKIGVGGGCNENGANIFYWQIRRQVWPAKVFFRLWALKSL